MKQVAKLSQRDRSAGWVSYGQKWKTVTGRQYFTDIIGLSSTTMMALASKVIEWIASHHTFAPHPHTHFS